jgi:hypothetical protein
VRSQERDRVEGEKGSARLRGILGIFSGPVSHLGGCRQRQARRSPQARERGLEALVHALGELPEQSRRHAVERGRGAVEGKAARRVHHGLGAPAAVGAKWQGRKGVREESVWGGERRKE